MMTKDNNIDPSKIVGAWEYIHYYSYDKDDIDGVNEFEYDVVKGDENWYKLWYSMRTVHLRKRIQTV